MADVTLDMLMFAVSRALDDLRLLKEGMGRVEKHLARSERRDAENLAMQAESRLGHADHSAQIADLVERIERIERRLELRETPDR
jgi:hypothetical protein